ncbi:hypothetical protein, partial [Burkholderia sp. BDU5]|uniref:hypothetical protein n=1 Tax=Burkholderia sp. BDU5 TaxID=1385590 RepID=UPI000AAD7874
RRLAAPANMRTFHLLQNRTFLFVRDTRGEGSAGSGEAAVAVFWRRFAMAVPTRECGWVGDVAAEIVDISHEFT